MHTVFRAMAILSVLLTVVATGVTLLAFRRERPMRIVPLVLSLGLALILAPAFVLASGVRLRPLVALPTAVVGLVLGVVRGSATKVRVVNNTVVGRNPMLYIVAWGGSLAVAQVCNLLDSVVLASAGLLPAVLTSGAAVGLGGVLLLKRVFVRRD